MLNWTRRNMTWFGNGFRIEKETPNRWLLFEQSPPDSGLVEVDPAPLATLPTLSSAKYTAELLHRGEETSAQRRRMALVGAGAAATALLIPGYPMAALVIGAVAGAAGLELIRSWLGPHTGSAREIIQ